MHINRLFLNFLLVVTTSNLEAQTNYLKGTIVNNNNDSIQGFIDFRNWETNPKSITFKKNLEGSKTTYSPTQIKAFMVGGDLYEAHKIKLEEGLEPTADQDGSYMSFKTPNDSLIFMRCHVKGYWNLYSHSLSNGKSTLYVNKGKDTLSILAYKKTIAINSDGMRFGMRETYKRQLLKYFYDYQAVSTRIIEAPYSVSKIKGIVADYDAHHADKVPITYMAVRDKKLFQMHVFGGVNTSTLAISSFTDLTTTPRIPDQTITGQGIDIGVSAQWFSMRRINKVSFVADLDFKTMLLSKDFMNNYVSSKTTFNNSYLRLYTQVRYQLYRTQTMSISVNGGTVLSRSLKMDNNYTTTYRSSKEVGILFKKGDFKQYNLGFVAGLMGQYKAFALELRGETNGGMSPYVTISSRLNTVSALLYYRLY
jgi:hypothetical protein